MPLGGKEPKVAGMADTIDLSAELKRCFGHDAFRPGQETVVRALLEGRSALALFPTGAGKSLCYQLPALLMDGVTLVVSPLIALMKDQVEVLRSRGIEAARLDSSISPEEYSSVMTGLVGGRLKLLYVAPERLTSEVFVTQLKRAKIAMMAVDEAHCISEWGHNFRPEYLRLARVARQLRIRTVLALTATATKDVAKEIRSAFKIRREDHVQTSFRRPNLRYVVTPCSDRERIDLLAERLRKHPGASIVYVTLQQTAEMVATALQKRGFPARAYHAGLPAEVRHEAQDAFMNGATEVIVATIAFGMGIDKADIRAVYHYNLPKSLENYMQETGRAGRDGKPSVCEMLACGDDRIVLENFVYGDTPTAASVRQLVDHLLRQGNEFDISVYDLSISTDIRPLVIETVLTHLELEGLLKPLGSMHAGYRFKLLHDEEQILSGHKPDRRRFLSKLFRAGKKGREWVTLTVDEAAMELGESRERIVKALCWLEEAGEIALKPSGVRQRFRLETKAGATDPRETASRLAKVFEQREARDLARLDGVQKLIEGRTCIVRGLLRYFGERMEQDCGECTSCKSPGKRRMPFSKRPGISLGEVEMIRTLVDEGHASLRNARALARFLCGLRSPAAARERLGRHEAFGLLERVPFQDVLDQAESMPGR